MYLQCSLRPLIQFGLRRSLNQPSSQNALIKFETYYSSGNCRNHNLRYFQPIFNETPCSCLKVRNLTRHVSTKLCYHPRLRVPDVKSCAFHDILSGCGTPTAPGIFHRFSIFGSNQIQRVHTSSIICESSKSPPTETPEDKDPSLAYERSGQSFLKGPDQIIPSEAIYTWHPRGAVRFSKLGKEPGISRPPISVPSFFRKYAEMMPNHPALAEKRNNVWEKWTYEEYYDDSWKAAKAFIALGLERYHAVTILGLNSPEWFFANMGAIMAGGIPAGIYTTNSPSACAYIVEDCKANVCVVEDEQQLSKINQFRSKFPHLKAIVQYKGKPTCDGVLSWDEFMKIGEQQSDEAINERLKQIAVNQCCTLIYTSGTTGNAKGVMISHDNITWISEEAIEFGCFKRGKEHLISYLPLSHIAAQTADLYFPMCVNGTVYFADSNALKGTLIDTMREIQPTKFLAVPRVWEKMYEALREIGRKNAGAKRIIADWAKKHATICNQKRLAGDPNPESFQFKLADALILSNVRKALGLSRCDFNMSAAAPLSNEIIEYFMSLNVIITEAYGLSECSGPHCMGVQTRNLVRIGSIGHELFGLTTKLCVETLTPDGQGELCLGGRHILMGYMGKEELTRKAIGPEGWLHSEDMGKIDEDGYIFITGRIKELLITAGGENVAPVPIEDNVKQALPCLSNAMLIGDHRKFLSVLITFRTEMDPDTHEALDQLTGSCKKWVESRGKCTVNTVKDLLDEVYVKNNSKLINAISRGMMRANSQSLSKAQKVRKWVILPRDFSLKGGELGPTMKLKRSVVEKHYHDLICDIYKEDPKDTTGAVTDCKD